MGGGGDWWMFASPVQIPRKGKGDMPMEGLSPAWQASTGGYTTEVSWSKPINVCIRTAHLANFRWYDDSYVDKLKISRWGVPNSLMQRWRPPPWPGGNH